MKAALFSTTLALAAGAAQAGTLWVRFTNRDTFDHPVRGLGSATFE